MSYLLRPLARCALAVDADGNTPLHLAAATAAAPGALATLQALAGAGRAALLADNGAGETPLHCAAGAGATAEAVQALAEGGAAGRRDGEGRTALLRLCLAAGCSAAAVRDPSARRGTPSLDGAMPISD